MVTMEAEPFYQYQLFQTVSHLDSKVNSTSAISYFTKSVPQHEVQGFDDIKPSSDKNVT
jgi:hypothetical protein